MSRNKKFSKETPFLVDGRVTVCDFHLYELLNQIQTAENVFESSLNENNKIKILELPEFQFLKVFYYNFEALPQMESYLSSDLNKLPFNNLMANFGSIHGGGKFVHNETPLPIRCHNQVFNK